MLGMNQVPHTARAHLLAGLWAASRLSDEHVGFTLPGAIPGNPGALAGFHFSSVFALEIKFQVLLANLETSMIDVRL